jgi:hypothetical protein
MKRFLMTTGLIVLLVPSLLFAKTWQGRAAVSYVTADGIYINAGTNAGIAVDDTIRIIRDDEELATAIALFVAESSTSCEIVSGDLSDILVGDNVWFNQPERVLDPLNESPVYGVTPAPTTPPPSSRKNSRPVVANQIDGRIGIQLRMQTDSESGHDVMEPGVSARLRIRNLFASSVAFQFRARSRRTIRDRDVGADLHDEWNSRVYEAALVFDHEDSRLGYRAGRIYASHISGIGGFDGAYAEYEFKDAWTIGAFGGLRPDPSTSEINPDDVKTGVFLHHERGDNNTNRVSATLAIAGSYYKGEIDEEFVYQQLRYSVGRNLSLYESAEVAINRGWRKDASGSSTELDNILLRARFSPVDEISIDAGFDNRNILRTRETRDTPDSLFNDNARQGWRLGTTVKLNRDMRFSAQANMRTQSGEGDNTITGHTRLSHRNLFDSGVSGNVRVAYYNSPYSTGVQPSLGFAFYALRNTRFSLDGGSRSYQYDSGDDIQTDIWIQPSVSINIGRKWYSQAYYELTRGDLQNTNRIALELGMRF